MKGTNQRQLRHCCLGDPSIFPVVTHRKDNITSHDPGSCLDRTTTSTVRACIGTSVLKGPVESILSMILLIVSQKWRFCSISPPLHVSVQLQTAPPCCPSKPRRSGTRAIDILFPRKKKAGIGGGKGNEAAQGKRKKKKERQTEIRNVWIRMRQFSQAS